MKNYFYLLLLIIITSCKEKAEVTNALTGHWMNKEFYEDVISKKNIGEITSPKTEIIIRENDTNLSYIVIGKKVSKAPFTVFKKNHLISKDFFAINRNAEIVLKDNTLEFIDPFSGEKEVFVKIDSSLFNQSEIHTYQTFSIPFIHQKYISGKYQLDSAVVTFYDYGKIEGLGEDFRNYSFCYDKSCMNGVNNTMFISNKKFEGNYYEYQIKPDSLIIYDIDKYAILRGFKSDRMGVKYALKKIN